MDEQTPFVTVIITQNKARTDRTITQWRGVLYAEYSTFNFCLMQLQTTHLGHPKWWLITVFIIFSVPVFWIVTRESWAVSHCCSTTQHLLLHCNYWKRKVARTEIGPLANNHLDGALKCRWRQPSCHPHLPAIPPLHQVHPLGWPFRSWIVSTESANSKRAFYPLGHNR